MNTVQIRDWKILTTPLNRTQPDVKAHGRNDRKGFEFAGNDHIGYFLLSPTGGRHDRRVFRTFRLLCDYYDL